ncbi:hypothetical protein CROQUDRAFT_92031 [Cronartium quercuum f. sp. fusiforme G11]|uniref:Uncharacterized protein n=1 Tax=Cronartium quercuum f. sp. fusiforme G11 TaxID=708437 RepID=A0A9P6NJ15_9BASI|nr:hypothetical protein CROQUDRAFT_92031 [Cronartium quercuum f. sp. fusiforme G11]
MSSIPNPTAISPEIQAVITAALAAQAQVYEGTISQLESCLNNMSFTATTPAKPSATRFVTPPQATKGNTHSFTRGGSKPAPSHLNTKSRMTSSPANPKGSGSSSKPSTPSHKASSTGPAKKRPNQMQVQDYPKEFTGTKVMWGMVEANLPPPPVDQRLLEVFNMSFDNVKQVELAVENTAAASIVAEAEILTLTQGRMGAIKLGCGMLYLDEFAIHTIHSHLAHLGIYLWGPDLTESPDSLYNITSAHFKKETNAPGQFQICTARSVTLRCRQWLCKARYEFLLAQPGILKHYLSLAAKPSAHSDDEAIPGRKDVYRIKTLAYRSANANKFFQWVDLPIDFYNPAWFNKLPPSQKEKVANSRLVALLPNAAESLLPVPHPSEGLST